MLNGGINSGGCLQLETLKEDVLTDYPRVRAWYRRLNELPEFGRVHRIIRQVADRVGGIRFGTAAAAAAPTARL